MTPKRERPPFGRLIESRRRELGLSQKDLAARIKKENGEPISNQYVYDIEHGNRSPSLHIEGEFARVLGIEPAVLTAAGSRSLEQVSAYLRDYPEAASSIARLFQRARAVGFTGWKSVLAEKARTEVMPLSAAR